MPISLFRQLVKEYKLSPKLAPMFGAYPELSDICTQIVDFTGVNFRVREEPLAKEMLVDAIAGYRAARKANRPPNIAFLQGLLARSHELYASRYAAFKGEKYEVWAPFAEPLPAFEERQKPGYLCRNVDEACPDIVSQRSVAFQLAARVMNGHTFHLYFEDYHVAAHFADC